MDEPSNETSYLDEEFTVEIILNHSIRKGQPSGHVNVDHRPAHIKYEDYKKGRISRASKPKIKTREFFQKPEPESKRCRFWQISLVF